MNLEGAHLKLRSGFGRYLKNTAWMMTERVLRIVAALAVGIWVARYLGPEDFGTYNYVIALVALFSSVAKLGLDGVAVREFVNNPNHSNRYLGTVFWLKVIAGFVAFVALGSLFLLSDDKEINALFVIASAGFILQSFEVVEFYFQSKVLAKFASICKISQLAGSSILKVALVINQADLIFFVWVIFFDALSLAAAYFVTFKLHSKHSLFRAFDKKIAQSLLKDSWPLMFSAIVVTVYMRIDQIMIQNILGSSDLGLYSAAVKISEAVYFIPVIITASVFPAIVNAKNISEALYLTRLQNLYTFMAWLAIFLVLPIAFFSDGLISLLFGKSFSGAENVLLIHVWSSIFVFMGVACGRYLMAENQPILELTRTSVGAVSNVLLNLWLIPAHGITGAAIATLFAQVIANFGYDFLDKRLHGQLRMKITAIFCPWMLLKGVH